MSNQNEMPWKILIVDDDEDTHDVTEMALRRLVYEERPLLILHAFSALEARLRLIEHPDIAIALLDVVMENDTAGLDLVKTIREDMKNDNIRLILRTGNPGKAPEESVTLAYDINDYRGENRADGPKASGRQLLQRCVPIRQLLRSRICIRRSTTHRRN